MQRRKYTHLKAVEGLILSMRQDGLTLQEIADELGLSLKQMKNWSYRHNCENRNMLKGIAPKPKGRPRKDGQPPKQDIEKELYRLRMENKLLRDFLQSTERKCGQGQNTLLFIVTAVNIQYRLCASSLVYPEVDIMTL